MCRVQTLTVTPVLTTKTLPLVLKAAATPALPGSVLPQRPPTVTMVTTAITKPDSQSAPINLQVASKLTNQSAEPVRLVSKNAVMVRRLFFSSAAAPGWAPAGLPTLTYRSVCCCSVALSRAAPPSAAVSAAVTVFLPPALSKEQPEVGKGGLEEEAWPALISHTLVQSRGPDKSCDLRYRSTISHGLITIQY